MKVLFVPMMAGGLSHLLPLMALNKMLANTSIETAFLCPDEQHAMLRERGVPILDIDHKGFRSEIPAYKSLRPMSSSTTPVSTGAATLFTGVPRRHSPHGYVSWRCSEKSKHGHSMHLSPDDLKKGWTALAHLGLPAPKVLSDLFRAPIRSCPVYPQSKYFRRHCKMIQYFFAGPLVMDDYLVGNISGGKYGFSLSNSKTLVRCKSFSRDIGSQPHLRDVRHGRQTDAGSSRLPAISDGQRIAVVSNIKLDNLSEAHQELHYYAAYLPMHYL